MSEDTKRLIGALLILIVLWVGLSLAMGSGPRSLNNLWFNLKNSIFKSGTSTMVAPVPLYQPVADYENAVIGAVKKVSPAVVAITISKNLPTYRNCQSNPFSDLPAPLQEFFGRNFYYSCDDSSELTEVGGGSGFIISKNGLILTNKHVVADDSATYTVFTSDGKKYEGEVVGRDPLQDLAILKIDAENLPVVTLGNSDDLELGQSVIAIGNALGEFKNTVAVGVVSGLNRSITAGSARGAETIQGVIQTDAAINPGNSGGPLINLRGDVIGVNVAVVQGAQNIGFALPVNWSKADIETVLAGKEIRSPYLGVRYVMLTPQIAADREVKVSYGALIAGVNGEAAVIKDSPADKAGLKEGDVILSIDGESLEDKDLSQVLARKNIGDKLKLNVFRGGRTIPVSVTLGERTQ